MRFDGMDVHEISNTLQKIEEEAITLHKKLSRDWVLTPLDIADLWNHLHDVDRMIQDATTSAEDAAEVASLTYTERMSLSLIRQNID